MNDLNNYKSKYLKYKNKYLELSRQIQKGGDRGKKINIVLLDKRSEDQSNIQKKNDFFLSEYHNIASLKNKIREDFNISGDHQLNLVYNGKILLNVSIIEENSTIYVVLLKLAGKL